MDYISTVNIELTQKGKKPQFCIKDNGRGMDEETISMYFLKAGASYRKSANWAKEFTDKRGNSLVQRSGRFGVGALAAFLLGDTIKVETRRLGAKHGLAFEASINDEQIEIHKIDCNIGTKITIELKKGILKKLNTISRNLFLEEPGFWTNWYKFKTPKITYSMDT